MMHHQQQQPPFSLQESEIQRLASCLREPEFRGLLLEYVRDITENAPLREKEMQDYASSPEGGSCSVEFLHPEGGFVLVSPCVSINLCSDGKISRAYSNDEDKNSWSIPYAVSPSRKHLHENGETVSLVDVLFHPFSLKKAIRNRRFKTLLKETAINAAIQVIPELKIKEPSFSILPNVRYLGRPHTLLLRPKTPSYSLKYREEEPFEKAINNINTGKTGRPQTTIIEIHLPEIPGAQNIDLDVTRQSLKLSTKDPVAYQLQVPFSYPVDEEKGSAKFEKSSRKLIVSIPIIASNQKMERFHSVDSGIDSDTVSSSPDLTEEELEEEEESEDSSLMEPSYRLDLKEENSLTLTLDVKNVERSSLNKTTFSQERLRGYRIRFSSMGAGMVRYDYSFAFALSTGNDVSPDSSDLEEPLLDLWDNSLTIDIHLSKNQDQLFTGKSPQELTVQSNPSLEALKRQSQSTSVQPLKKEVILKPETDSPKAKLTPLKKSTEECSSSSSGRFSVTPLDDEETPCLPPLTSFKRTSIRGILKRRVRSYSESQADQLRRWEEAAASLSTSSNLLLKDYVVEEEDGSFKEDAAESLGKKSVRFSDHVQRQIFRQNASILGQRQKNLKKNEHKKRKNAMRQRRASEGDAQKEGQESFTESDSGVFSSSEDPKEDLPPTSAKSKSKRTNDALANVFQQSEQLMFDLDIE